jgi:hypothetical protein
MFSENMEMGSHDWQRVSDSADMQRMKTILHGMSPIQIMGGDGQYYLIPAMMLGGSQATETFAPFHVYSKYDDDGKITNVGIDGNSYIYSNQADTTSPLTLPSLSDPNDENDHGWISAEDKDYIWLEITISGGLATTVEIKKGLTIPGEAWTSGGYVEDDGATPPTQTKARKVIAQIDGFVKQYVWSNLVMQNMCIDGQPALYPVPY